MTYQVLARKWRPGKFSDLVGQAHVLKPLTHALDNQRLHHAYLFTGTRGVGKTTLARILAKCLNCEEGVSSKPCGACQACAEIAEGRFIDLIEVDAASRTKVEDTRELLENVQYAPSRGRYKIYLIDEVHMLSAHSFNALLKTLEEPPPHVMFLLATTDPQKLPVTILSRCLQFNLKNLSPQLIEEYLEHVLDSEKISFEEAALWQLATAAAGSMRDALTLLDQAISFCEGKVTETGVSDMLGAPEQAVVWQLLECLAIRDASVMLQTVQEVAERAPDFQQLLEAVLATLHRLAIAQVLPDAIDNSYGDRDQVLNSADRFSAEDLQLFYQFGVKGRADLNLASDTRAMFEMLLIRMLVFSPEGVPTVPGKPENAATPGSGQASDPTDSPAGHAGEPKMPPQEARARPPEELQDEPQEEPKKDRKKEPQKKTGKQKKKSEKQPVTDETAETMRQAVTGPSVKQAEKKNQKSNGGQPPQKSQTADHRAAESVGDGTQAGQAAKDVDTAANQVAPDRSLPRSPQLLDNNSWIPLCQHLHPGGITGNILAHCVITSAAAEALNFCLDSTQSAVFSEEHRSRIEQLLADYFQRPLQVAIEVGEPACESPAAFGQRIRREKLEQLRNRFEQDDNVQKLVETFSAEVLKESISPTRQ